MAEHANTPSASITRCNNQHATRDEFDAALSDANTIAGIIEHLADHAVGGEEQLFGSHFVWLADQLKARLERIEVADC